MQPISRLAPTVVGQITLTLHSNGQFQQAISVPSPIVGLGLLEAAKAAIIQSMNAVQDEPEPTIELPNGPQIAALGKQAPEG